jgi:hypothetical protein
MDFVYLGVWRLGLCVSAVDADVLERSATTSPEDEGGVFFTKP